MSLSIQRERKGARTLKESQKELALVYIKLPAFNAIVSHLDTAFSIFFLSFKSEELFHSTLINIVSTL